MSIPPVLEPLYAGWARHQELLLAAITPLAPEQLALRVAPGEWTVWQLASHIAGSRSYWLHDVLGEGDPSVAAMFRVTETTVAGLALEDAGWEDDERHPRTAAEILEAFERTWALVSDCLERWAADDLTVRIPQRRRGGDTTRAWVIWHLMEHDIHHGGAISAILGAHGLPGLDM